MVESISLVFLKKKLAGQAGLRGSVYFELLFYYAVYRDLYWQQFETGPAKVAVKTEDLLDIFLAHEGE